MYNSHTHTRVCKLVNCKKQKKKQNKLANKVQMKKNANQVALMLNFVKLYKIWFLLL